MALDIELYESFLGILGVQPTGDPVADAVYLVLLPMVIIYLFIEKVIGNSRFGHNPKVKIIMMFITAFTIVYYKYYGLFAAFSMPLLVFVILWHTLGFVFGKKNKDSPSGGGKIHAQVGSDGDYNDYGDNDIFHLRKVRNTVESLENIKDTVNHDILGSLKEEKGRLTELEDEYKKYCNEWNKVREKTGDRASGDIMHELNVQLESIVEEARTLAKRINNKNIVKNCAPKLSKKLGIY